MQLRREQINGQATERKTQAAPRGHLFACCVDDPAADLGRDRTFRKCPNERPRPENAPLRMLPPQQSFRADYGIIRKPDLRLEIHLKLIFREGPSQFDVESAPRLRPCAKYGLEKATGAASIGFRLIKRKVGVCEQFINVQSIIGGNGHPSTASKVEGVITDLEGFRKPLEHLADNLADHAWITAIGNDHDKLIATKAEHLMRFVASFAELKQTLADVNKQLVADRVTERVVHVLEAVRRCVDDGSKRVLRLLQFVLTS